jgi:DUF4097 and DUF4098 domain-containing protein YvlB
MSYIEVNELWGQVTTIRVPRKIQLERITTSNGSIRVWDVEGQARLKTTNGAVRVERLRGPLDTQTSNGAIEVVGQEGGANLRTSNGRIRAEDVRGEFEAVTSNGGVHAELTGPAAGRPVRVETTNGAIDVAFAGESASSARISTTNGSITLRLPGQVNARVMASTTNSGIRTEFDVSGTSDKRHLEGNIGSGGPVLDLSTTNGRIALLKR